MFKLDISVFTLSNKLFVFVDISEYFFDILYDSVCISIFTLSNLFVFVDISKYFFDILYDSVCISVFTLSNKLFVFVDTFDVLIESFYKILFSKYFEQ